YMCTVEDCGKCFHRGEHLKRHIRSIHTHDKPFKCEQPGCGKFFNRHDNLLQHLKVHTHTRRPTEQTESLPGLMNPPTNSPHPPPIPDFDLNGRSTLTLRPDQLAPYRRLVQTLRDRPRAARPSPAADVR
ncbi:hypothetical protein BDZ89DRAFT_974657, partial [Hymenopellis radicata]